MSDFASSLSLSLSLQALSLSAYGAAAANLSDKHADFQKAKYAAAILSTATQETLEKLTCAAHAHDAATSMPFNSEEFLMKLNARLLWVNRKEYWESQEYELPWAWLKQLGGAPVGSWLSLAAVYIGSRDKLSDMLLLWQQFTTDLRLHFDNGVPLARLYTPTPIDGVGGEYALDRLMSMPDRLGPMHQRLLWDDVLAKKQRGGGSFSLPDRTKTIAYQKLQMLQMCILCKDESPFVQIEVVESDARLLGERNIKVPLLLRRLPMTGDTQLQQKFISNSIDAAENKTNEELPLLKWQISHPGVVSDCRAFKAMNPDKTLEDFEAFYSISALSISMDAVVGAVEGHIHAQTQTSVSAYRDILREIFVHCDPVETESQKPLFKASTEAEKALGYMESMSVLSVGSELLLNAMSTIHYMLSQTCPSFKRFPSFLNQLESLRAFEEQATQLIKADISCFEGDDSSSICQSTLLAIDKVCTQVERIEVFIQKLHFLEANTVPVSAFCLF